MTSQTYCRKSAPAAVPPPAEVPDELSGASISQLVSRLTTQLSELVRGELAKGKRSGAGAGVVLAWFAGLAVVLPVWLAALIVAAALLIVAGVLALVARPKIAQAAPPTPEQAIEGLQRDVATVKEAARR